MKTKYIGTTLLFSKNVNEVYHGIQASYILKLNTFQHFIEDLNNLANETVSNEFPGYEYIGVTDLYISEKEGEGHYLGRTSYYNTKTLEEAKKMCLSSTKLSGLISEKLEKDLYNVGLVYFNEDREGPEFHSTIIVYTQLKTVRDKADLAKMAKSSLFKQKITHFAVEQLFNDDLKYVGVIDFYKVQDKGLFVVFGKFEHFRQLKKEVLTAAKLEKSYEGVIEDYEYVD